MYCQKCGNHLSDDSLFCNKCGQKVGDTDDQTSISDVADNTKNQKAEDDFDEVYQKFVEEKKNTQQSYVNKTKEPLQYKINHKEIADRRDKKAKKQWDNIFTGVGCLGIVFIIYILFSVVSSCGNTTTQYKDIDDITNKEMQEFREWEYKENQKKWENEKYFNN